MGQYCFARWRLSAYVVVCNTAVVGRLAAGQSCYVPLRRHLVANRVTHLIACIEWVVTMPLPACSLIRPILTCRWLCRSFLYRPAGRDGMGRSYVNHSTAATVLICACIVMAASDVADTSSSSSSRYSLAKILNELRHLTQAVQDRPPEVQASVADSDIGETRWSNKRDPEWDTDYGWGGGRFGKRRDQSHQV